MREAACSDSRNVAVFDRRSQNFLNPFSLICWPLPLISNLPGVVLGGQDINMVANIAHFADFEAVKEQPVEDATLGSVLGILYHIVDLALVLAKCLRA